MDPRLYDASAIASGFVPGSGLMDLIGQAPAIGGGMGPSFMENMKKKQYIDAMLQMAGAAGDALMIVPPVGMTVKAATTAGKTARAGGKTADALTAAKKAAKKAAAPQEEALRLAQQRAALPVEEGGLGLPKDNTPMDRAKAMGFDADFAHGSPLSDITKFEPSKTGEMGRGIYATNYFPEADIYAGKETGATTYPLKVKTSTAYQAGEENPYMKLVVGDDDQLQNALQRIGKESIIKTQQPPPDWLKALGTMDMPTREHFVSMNPDLFRSRFAAFDPFRRNAAIAAAMGVAAPNLLAAETEKKKEEQQSNSLLRMLGF